MTDVPRLASPANGYNARNPPNQTERTYADAFYSSTVWWQKYVLQVEGEKKEEI